ncbi:MAG: GNAT family N-acetyltransferase [Bacteroidales bacterium]|nr:GNAT family N-acetyltransferase [Bacteroidales bacterium]
MQKTSLTIERYTPKHAQIWDDFVEKSKNGTFLFKRAYMDYHANRFEDFSLLIFENKTLIAVLPANKNENVLYSHQGLTYGSLLVNTDISQNLVLAIFDALKAFLKPLGFEKIYYKTVPAIYHKLPCEEDLYALFRNEAKLVVRNCSTTFDIQKSKTSSKLRLSRISEYTKKHKLRYEIHKNVDAFWKIAEENLMKKHNVFPVHSQTEINLLQSKFPKNIQAIAVFSDDKIVAGAVVYLANDVAHLQYAAVSSEGEKIYAGEFLYELFISKLFSDFSYFDFGISTEKGGQFLNEGLIAYKEKFGGSTIVYDHYEIEISSGESVM